MAKKRNRKAENTALEDAFNRVDQGKGPPADGEKRTSEEPSGPLVLTGQQFSQNGKKFVSIQIPHPILEGLAFSRAFVEEDGKGDQRAISMDHARKFARAIDDRKKKKVHPQSIVGTLANGAYIKEAGKPDDMGVQIVTITFPSRSGDYLQLQDGQHSVAALSMDIVRKPVKDAWTWSVSVQVDSSDKAKKILHADINAHQKAPNKSVVGYMRFTEKDLEPDQMRIGKVFDSINTDKDSVMFQRVKCYNKQTRSSNGAAIGFLELVDRSRNILLIDAVSAMDDDELLELVDLYYDAWRTHNEDTWSDPTAYLTSEIMGIKVITKVMKQVLEQSIRRNKINFNAMSDVIEKASGRIPRTAWLKGTAGSTKGHGYGHEKALLTEIVKAVLPPKQRDAALEELELTQV